MTAAFGVLLLALTSCGAPASYTSPDHLKDAYVEHGGECDSPQDVPESMLSEGSHGILCGGTSMALLIVFDSTQAKDRYLARSGAGMVTYGGDRWVAMSETPDVVRELGGSEITQ